MDRNVRDFGAAGDGTRADHPWLQAALDSCADTGGGTVTVPAGHYRCGTIRLRSNVCLDLDEGAVIEAIPDESLFPEICRTLNLPGKIQALVWAEDLHDVAIRGHGTIDGGGRGAPISPLSTVAGFRPALCFFRNCRQVRIEGVRLHYSCFWTLHLLRCVDVEIRGIAIRTDQGRINTDGIDPDGCTDVRISACTIRTGDDAIVLKSTEGQACENVTVTDCVLSSAQAAIKLGTESLADIRNFTARNCTIDDAKVGLALYMKDGATFENVRFEALTVRAASEFAIVIDSTPRYFDEPCAGAIRDVVFNNITMDSRGRCYIEGFPQCPIERVSLSNLTWNVPETYDFSQSHKPWGAARVRLDPLHVNYAATPHHFVAVNVKDLDMANVQLIDRKVPPGADRGLLWLHRVRGAHLKGVRGYGTPPGVCQTVMEECEQIRLE